METILLLDQKLFHWLNTSSHPLLLNSFMIVCTRIGDKGLFWFGVALVLLLFRHRVGGIRPTVTLLTGIGIGGILEMMLKTFISRPRPPLAETHIQQLVELPVSSSFPSGHAISSFVSMYILYRLFPKSIYWTFPCAIIMSYSRIYVGVHYPLDVIIGAFIGLSAGMLTMRLPIMAIIYKVLPRIPVLRRYVLPASDTIPPIQPAETSLDTKTPPA